MSTRTPSIDTKDTTTTATNKYIRKMNIGPRPRALQYLKDIVIVFRSMDTKCMNANPRTSGHQTNRQRYTKMKICMIRITTQGIVVTIAKNMDMFLEII